jgi:hypothetical protein
MCTVEYFKNKRGSTSVFVEKNNFMFNISKFRCRGLSNYFIPLNNL